MSNSNNNYDIDELTLSMTSLCVKKYNTSVPWNYNPVNNNDINEQKFSKIEDDGYDSDYAHWRK